MAVRRATIGLAVVLMAISAVTVWAGPKTDAYSNFNHGNDLLTKGDFDGAYWAYKAAARLDQANEKYRGKMHDVRRIMKLREALGQTKNPDKWLAVAKQLHTFYLDNSVRMEALTIAGKIHSQEGSAESAALLARTRLEMGLDTDAAEGLRSVTEMKVNAQLRVLMGIALARQGKTNDAEKLLQTVKEPPETGEQFLYDLARLQAQVGTPRDAFRSLRRCFEATPPSQLATMKKRAQQCADFASLKQKTEFAQVFETQSKISEPKSNSKTTGERKYRPSQRKIKP